ncbi:alpha/beta fold hydrolase [Ideonella sp.]|uniref:alpha/beta fold hydrolase n=1 Tax=Ideonella sp. TaxID=1929293 RepID=UPI0035B4EFB5
MTPTTPPPQDKAPIASTVTLPSGLSLNLLRWPAAEGSTAPPALLVHGLGDCAWVWQGVAPALAEKREVLAVDLRGHGGSPHVAPSDYQVREMAADLSALVEVLGLRKPLLIGHSLGAAVAIQACAAAPERYAALALVDYATEVAPANIKLVRTALALMHGTYDSIADYVAILRRRHVLANPQLLEAVAHAALRPTDAGHRPRFDIAVLDALCHGDDLATTNEQLGRLQLPVLVVRGALSWVVSRECAQSLVAACPQAELAVVPMAGHSVQIDNPRGLLTALGRWFEPALAC